MPVNSTTDGNQTPTLVLYAGTAGTADTRGTSTLVGASGDPATGAQYVYNLGPAGSVSLGNINDGTLAVRPQAGGDPGTALTVRLTDGTTFYNASGAGGGTSVQIVHGTVENSGTVTGVGVVSAVTSGTIQNSGTTTGVGVVSALTSGTVAVSAGTIGAGTINTMGTLSNLLAGTIQSCGTATGVGVVTTVTNLSHGTVENSGTVTGVGVVTALTSGTIQNSGTTTGVGVVSNITNGSIVVTAGTITQTTGTINSGTINAGTVTSQPYPASQVQPAFAVGTAAIGTLVSAIGAGTGIYVNSITLSCMSGTLDMCLSFGLGSTTNQVVNRGLYVPGGGVAQSFPAPSFYGTANSALTYQILSGAGTASWAVTYNTKGTP